MEEVFETASKLEENGDTRGAWDLLFGLWIEYTDHEYFEEEKAPLVRERIDALLDRNPELIDQRVQIMMEDCSIEAYHSGGGHDVSVIEDAMRLAQDANRPDLELEAFEHHVSIQVGRFGAPYRETEGLKDKHEALKEKASSFHKNNL